MGRDQRAANDQITRIIAEAEIDADRVRTMRTGHALESLLSDMDHDGAVLQGAYQEATVYWAARLRAILYPNQL